MSIIYGVFLGIFMMFFPTIMTLYYKSKSTHVLIIFIMCVIGIFTAFIPTLLAYIFAMVSVGFWKTIKSFFFVMFLLVIGIVFFAFDMSIVASLVGGVP